MTQLDIFEQPPPWVRGSLTSFDSSRAIAPTHLTDQARVLAALKACAATDQQLQGLLRMDPSTQRPRRVRLVELGLIRDSGRTAKTLSGRNATIWEICG